MFRFIFLLALVFINHSFGKSKNYPVVANEVIVKYKNGFSKNINKRLNVSKKKIRKINNDLGLIKFEEKIDLIKKIKDLKQTGMFEYVEPNYIYKAIGKKALNLPKDPMFKNLWGLKNTGNNSPKSERFKGVIGADISALNAWKITKGSKKIKIAVIDTGVDYKHPDLKNNMWVNLKEKNGKPGKDDDGNGYIDDIYGYDFANNDGDPMDGNDHGTHCAGTIAAEHNKIGVSGVMAHAQIIAVKFLSDEGSGTADEAVRAIEYAIKVGAHIMSNSWGSGGYSQAIKEAIIKARDAGIIFTAAAGNSADNTDTVAHYPSNYQVENVISVAAHTIDDKLANFSSYGGKTVHIAAPGHNILSTTAKGKYNTFSGTSMATPHVSGVLGLYLEKYGFNSFLEIKRDLLATSVYSPAYDRTTIGGGRLNAEFFLKKQKQFRPLRPDPTKWQRTTVTRFESIHPYSNDAKYSKTFKLTGAKFVRVVVKEHDMEENYDQLRIKDKDGIVVQTIDGKGTNTLSDFVRGDTVTIEFISDQSVSFWGFQIDEVEYIK